ncbi:MAG: S24 family peptidase [FCB group bacterium]
MTTNATKSLKRTTGTDLKKNISLSQVKRESHYGKRKPNTKVFALRSKLDLSLFLGLNPVETFMIRVMGDSMQNSGIHHGSYLLVDRSLKPENNRIVIASINDELVVKKICYTGNSIVLISENDNFKPIKIRKKDKFEIWGVVTSVIKNL